MENNKDINSSNPLKISVHFEGGLGDHLCANRFIPAIKEYHKNCEIIAFSNTENNFSQKNLLELCYPSFYKEIKVIPDKKYKKFVVNTQFGEDNFYGSLDNLKDDVKKQMESYDVFYDLHIDSLKFLDYSFDWYRYFYFWPKPEIGCKRSKQICLHLLSGTSTGHILEKWYIEYLVNNICKKFPDYKIIGITTENVKHSFDNIKNFNFKLFIGDLKEIIKIIGSSEIMISTDSGLRYIAMGYSIPVITFSQQSTQPYSALPSHTIRWLNQPHLCFPLNYDGSVIVNLIGKILSNKGYALVPYLNDFDNQCVRRKFSINLEKSILNN